MLRGEAEKAGIEICFIGSRDHTSRFFRDNRDKFHETKDGIAIEEGVTPWHLIYDRSPLTDMDLVIFLESKDIALKTLKIMGYEVEKIKELKNIEEYMSELKDTIDKAALEWDFDRCIPLKRKYKELEMISGMIEKNSKVKTKTENENK